MFVYFVQKMLKIFKNKKSIKYIIVFEKNLYILYKSPLTLDSLRRKRVEIFKSKSIHFFDTRENH